jgi:hypothetical protein
MSGADILVHRLKVTLRDVFLLRTPSDGSEQEKPPTITD